MGSTFFTQSIIYFLLIISCYSKSVCNEVPVQSTACLDPVISSQVIPSNDFTYHNELSSPTHYHQLPDCSDKPKDSRELLLITTLDGKISALDIEKHGELSWSRDTGPGGLLSSTISNYEITKKGQIVRVIPSLDGNLYLFNGNSIESIPMSTESLLKSSYKVGDDLMVSGGQENKIYGINILTGELYYECGMAGCPKSETIENETNQDLVLIKRITQTVRAIEVKTGKEKWHFSVGDMHINVPHTDDCQSDKLKNNTNDDIILKVIVPDGLVTAQKDALQDAWDHKFETPIVNIWHFKNGHLKSINLFDNKKLYGFESFIKDFGIKSSSPEIYVGLHNRQWYIQMSNEMIQEKQEENKKGNDVFVLTSEQLSSQYQLLQIDWQQNNKTESSNQNNKEHQVNSNSVQITSKLFEILSYNLQTAGYYFVPHNSTVCSVNQTINNTTKTDPKTKDKCYISYTVKDENGISNLVTISICDHWMEIVLIFFVLWISLNFIVCRIKMLFWKTSCQQVQFVSFEILPPEQKEQKQQIIQQQDSSSQSDDHETRTRRSISTNSSASGDGNGAVYSSRYLDDFEQIRLLGKGGFGVVFEAKHKIDENNYAIKRISLPMKKEHRDKVKREVKALSKLDHIGIVRYFYTWEETPPEGWQEQMDKEWYDSDALTKSKLWKFNHNKESKIKNGNIKNEKEQRNGCKLFNDDNKDVISFDDGELNHKDKSNNTSSYVAFVNSQSERNNNEGKTTTEKIDQHSEEELNDEKYQEITKSINSGDYKRAYLYIQMQLCRKDTLRHWLLNNSMQRDKNIVFDIFVQIIDAVDYVHSMGLMHRDLKPSNIFFSMDGIVKIGDFGLVTASATECPEKVPSPLEGPSSIIDSSNNSNNLVSRKHTVRVGTQLYMSPEQLSGSPYCNKVDIYSMGIIFFELLVPFKTEMERVTMLKKVRKQKLPFDFKTKYPQECDFVKQLLSFDPCERPSAAEIKENSLFISGSPHEIVKRARCRTLSQSSTENPFN